MCFSGSPKPPQIVAPTSAPIAPILAANPTATDSNLDPKTKGKASLTVDRVSSSGSGGGIQIPQ